MEVVDEWTGQHAVALQGALRLTHEEMADFIGVSRRTVAGWHEKQETILRRELQRALDTAYESATEPVRIRFARQLRTEDAVSPTPTGQPLTVAIAVVVDSTRALLVCRQDSDRSGIDWQFPAGIVKPGNLPQTIAVRETLAETGVHCTVVKSIGSRLHPVSGVDCQYFLCNYLSGEAKNCDPEENIGVVWAPLSDVHKYIPTDRIFPPILDHLGGT